MKKILITLGIIVAGSSIYLGALTEKQFDVVGDKYVLDKKVFATEVFESDGISIPDESTGIIIRADRTTAWTTANTAVTLYGDVSLDNEKTWEPAIWFSTYGGAISLKYGVEQQVSQAGPALLPKGKSRLARVRIDSKIDLPSAISLKFI